MKTKAARMRELLKQGIVVSPGVYDGLSARMVEKMEATGLVGPSGPGGVREVLAQNR